MGETRGNPNFKKGNPKPSKSGRKKGSLNKTTRTVLEGYEYVHEHLGGDEAHLEWVKKSPKNREAFYQQRSKMLPSSVGIDGNIKHEHRLSIVDMKKSLKEYNDNKKREGS